MQLTKLRLSGFKSFVEPTELLLEPGLTGIVGPNGCGKSNIVDALKWVMGETSAKQLRGGEMDDVIFAGTQNRPARNFCEVVLNLDNALRKAPSQFNDTDALEVSRRIDRGEGSSYKVNARDVRARDVHMLFADAATGAHSTAIVSQGRVGHLVNAKPTERRLLLEEAAGITGLHARRHEAELRLNAAENNIKRSEDILRQLIEQLQSLKKQARQAAAYKSLDERFRATEALVYHHQWTNILSRLETATQRRTELDAQLTDLDTNLSEASAHQTELASSLPALRQKEAERAAALQRLKLAEHELQGEESRLIQAQMAVEQRLSQIETDFAREAQLRTDAEQSIARVEVEQTAMREARDGESEKLQTLQGEKESRAEALRSAEETLQNLSDKLASEEKNWSALQERQRQLQSRLETLGIDLAEADSRKRELTALLVADENLQASLQQVVFAEAEVANSKSKLTATEGAKTIAHATLIEAQKSLREFETQAAKWRAEADGLQSLLSGESDIADPVMRAISVETGYEAALSAALGDDLFAGLQDSADRYWQDLPPFAAAPALPGNATPLSRFVKAPAALSRALSLVGVIEDAAEGRALQSQLSAGQCLVSKSGALWRYDGYVASAGSAQKTAAHLRHKNRLAEIESLIAAESVKEAPLQSALQSAESELRQTTSAEAEARAQLDKAYSALEDARRAQSSESQRAAITKAQCDAATELAQRLATSLSEIEENLQTLSHEMGEQPDFDGQRAAIAAQRVSVEESRNQAFQSRAAYEQALQQSQQMAARETELNQQMQQWRTRLDEVESRTATLQQRRTDAQTEQQTLSEKPAQLAEARGKLLSSIADAETTRNEAADILTQAEQKLAEADKKARGLQNEISALREERVKHATAIELGEEEQQKLRYDIQERLETAPESLLDIVQPKNADDLPPLDAAQSRLERLRRERENMGPVNLRADIEAAETEAKQTAQQTAHDELIAATAKLRQGINELNKEGRERLTEAFTKVNENFSRLFTRLFGGGKAHMEWTEHEDVLDAGVEIFASPPGKKTQILSLLSGGERALTALALLFAVFECNPAPICVLDEVDAPLDENNVDRFCTMLEEMTASTPTRYLVITHHRMTMARMHRLFGVTMGEAGVSQLVSVDLAAAEALRATA